MGLRDIMGYRGFTKGCFFVMSLDLKFNHISIQ